MTVGPGEYRGKVSLAVVTCNTEVLAGLCVGVAMNSDGTGGSIAFSNGPFDFAKEPQLAPIENEADLANVIAIEKAKIEDARGHVGRTEGGQHRAICDKERRPSKLVDNKKYLRQNVRPVDVNGI